MASGSAHFFAIHTVKRTNPVKRILADHAFINPGLGHILRWIRTREPLSRTRAPFGRVLTLLPAVEAPYRIVERINITFYGIIVTNFRIITHLMLI